MHKIQEKEFTLEDFSCEHMSQKWILEDIINELNKAREYFNKYDQLDDEFKSDYSKKDFWWQMIQLLPSSYNQTRNVMMNYEVLANIYKSCRGHKLDEWCEFCKWIEGLPYSELICGFCFKDFEDGSSSIETLNDLGVLTKIPNAARVAIGLSPIGTSDELTFSKED